MDPNTPLEGVWTCLLQSERQQGSLRTFTDGVRLCVILHHYRPDLLSKEIVDGLKVENAKENLELFNKVCEDGGLSLVADVDDFLAGDELTILHLLISFCRKAHEGELDVGKPKENPEKSLCRKCQETLAGSIVRFDTFLYHQQCFCCSMCEKALSEKEGKVLNIDALPFCVDCGQTEWKGTIRARRNVRETERRRRLQQHKALLNFVNSRLSESNIGPLTDLSTDLSDGVALIELFVRLFNVQTPKYNKKPDMLVHKLDNLQLVIDLLVKVGLVEEAHSIEPKSILDGDLKTILGLLYKVSRKHQLSTLEGADVNERAALLQWLQGRLEPYKEHGVHAASFEKSFNDGRAFLALLDSERNGLVDVSSLDKTKKKENLEKAFKLAQSEFGICPMMSVEDFLSNKPDESAVITYVSEYFHVFSDKQRQEEAKRRLEGFSEVDVPEENENEEEDEEAPPEANVEHFEWVHTHSGYLLKQDVGVLKIFRQKYFELLGSRLLYWPRQPKDNEAPEAYISLKHIQKCMCNPRLPNAFLLETTNRVFHLKANSKEDMLQWTETINKAIEAWRDQKAKNSGADKEKVTLDNIEGLESISIVDEADVVEGYMYEFGKVLGWKLYFFALVDGILFKFKQKGEKQIRRIPLFNVKVEPYMNARPGEYCFQLTGSNSLILKVDNEEDCAKWMNAILKQKLITEQFLNSLERKEGVRPTHIDLLEEPKRPRTETAVNAANQGKGIASAKSRVASKKKGDTEE